MKFTRIPYQYRDADNYKLDGELDCRGAITDAQRQAFIESLDTPGDYFFIPEQVGLEHLLDLAPWGRDNSDHCWHEVFVKEIEVLDTEDWKHVRVDILRDINEVVETFVRAGREGWRDTTYGARFMEV